MSNSIFDQLMVHPSWVAGAVTLGTALAFFLLFRRERRRLQAKERYERRQCVSCGYDLRASQDRCPECGFPIQAPELPLTMRLEPSALRNNWPKESAEPRRPQPGECRVEVYASDLPMSVDLLAEQLTARGVDAGVSTNHAKSFDPISLVTTERTVKTLSVWSGDMDRAVGIIRSLSQAPRPLQPPTAV